MVRPNEPIFSASTLAGRKNWRSTQAVSGVEQREVVNDTLRSMDERRPRRLDFFAKERTVGGLGQQEPFLGAVRRARTAVTTTLRFWSRRIHPRQAMDGMKTDAPCSFPLRASAPLHHTPGSEQEHEPMRRSVWVDACRREYNMDLRLIDHDEEQADG
jgi:hypothetical protein